MQGVPFQIQDIIRQIYGYIPASFEVSAASGRKEQSDLGVPLYAKDEQGREYMMPVKLGGVQLPFPLFSIDPRNALVETPMNGQNGSVIEQINTDNYRMRVRGVCLGVNGEWPEAQMQQIANLFKRKESFEIENALTAMFDITHAVIESAPIFETKGLTGVIPYTIDLISDTQFELTIKKK